MGDERNKKKNGHNESKEAEQINEAMGSPIFVGQPCGSATLGNNSSAQPWDLILVGSIYLFFRIDVLDVYCALGWTLGVEADTRVAGVLKRTGVTEGRQQFPSAEGSSPVFLALQQFPIGGNLDVQG